MFRPFQLCLFFVYLISVSRPQVAKCYSCASTILKYQWQATSFPYMPTSDLIRFDDLCGNSSADLSSFAKPCANGVCVEELVVVGKSRKKHDLVELTSIVV